MILCTVQNNGAAPSDFCQRVHKAKEIAAKLWEGFAALNRRSWGSFAALLMRAIDRPLGWRPSSASHSVYQAFDLIARAICGDADEIDLAIRVIGRHMCNFDWQKPWLIGMQQRYPSVARISGQLCNQVGNSHGASQLETPFSLRTLDMHQRR